MITAKKKKVRQRPTFPRLAVSSAQKSLTSVFGMGTGGASLLWSPDKLTDLFFSDLQPLPSAQSRRESFKTRVNRKYGQASRSISIARLNTLLHLYLQPINRMFYPESLGDL